MWAAHMRRRLPRSAVALAAPAAALPSDSHCLPIRNHHFFLSTPPPLLTVDGKAQFSMLGLGDIVIPGIFVAILLRRDAAHDFKRGAYFYRWACVWGGGGVGGVDGVWRWGCDVCASVCCVCVCVAVGGSVLSGGGQSASLCVRGGVSGA